MLNILVFNDSEKKSFYKICSLKEYKAGFKINKVNDTQLLINTKKNLSTIKIEDINLFFEKHYFDEDNKVYHTICNVMDKKIKELFPDYSKMIDIIRDRNYKDLSEEEKEELKKFEKDYPEDKFKFNFDTFIKFCCVPTGDEIESIKNKKAIKVNDDNKKEIKEDNKKKLETLNDKINSQKEEIKELKRNLKEKNDLLEKTNKEKQSLLNKLSVSNVIKKFSSILPSGYKCDSASELYKKLSEIENEAANSNDFVKLKEVLAAKYSIVEIVEDK